MANPGSYREMDQARVLRMKELRDQGHSVQAVANAFGICKQRVSQLLIKHFGTAKVAMVTRQGLARRCGCSPEAIMDLERQGILKPLHYDGEGRYYYPEPEVGKVSWLVAKRCSFCGEPMPYRRHRYCQDCAAEHRRRLMRGYHRRSREGLRMANIPASRQSELEVNA